MANIEPETTETRWRAYWRFIFDVIDGVPRLQQEITLWPIVGLNRLAYSMKELRYRLVGSHSVEKDHIEFSGGHLRFRTNLHADITRLARKADLNTGVLSDASIAQINGENVYIRADVALRGDGTRTEYPIFFYPQKDAPGVRLIEVHKPADKSRGVKWSISNQFYLTHVPFTLEGFKKRHGLRVRQGMLDSQSIFEFHVDTIPIENQLTIADHPFPVGPQTAYIGWTPGNEEGLWGAVYHLTFDPNSSCNKCPQPTFDPRRDWQSE